MKMSSILGIEMKNEKLFYIDELKDGESLAVKIMYSLKQYGKINLFTGGIPNAVIINLLTSLLSTITTLDFGVTAVMGMILGFVLWGLFSIILSFYGYVRDDNSGLTYYSRSNDFRRK